MTSMQWSSGWGPKFGGWYVNTGLNPAEPREGVVVVRGTRHSCGFGREPACFSVHRSEVREQFSLQISICRYFDFILLYFAPEQTNTCVDLRPARAGLVLQ